MAQWFDATRRIQTAEKGVQWLRYKDQEYFQVVDMFRQAAPRYGADWACKLKKELRPHPELLNDLGCVLSRYAPQAKSLGSKVHIGTVMQLAMFSGAAHLGCETSALSMARWIALASYEDSDIVKKPLFRPTMDLQQKMLREGNPQAMYIEGVLLIGNSRLDAGIKILEKAYREYSKQDIWWAELCDTLGSAYQMKGNDALALEFWGKAIEEGSVDALQGFSRLTPEGPRRDDAMYKLACKGDTVALENIAAAEQTKLHEQKFDTAEERAFQEKWAAEWEKMARHNVYSKQVLHEEGN